VWLARVAAEGWVIFSHDRKFHSLLPERSAIKQYNAGCFYLGGATFPLWDKLNLFMRGYAGFRSRVQATAKPFIFNLSHAGRFSRVKIPDDQ
jgi:hypothetical protein